MKKYVLVPHHDYSGVLTFENGEAKLSASNKLQESELLSMLLKCDRYRDIIPFLNHEHSFEVLFQDAKKHNWDMYPHVDPTFENGINIIILFEYDQSGKCIFEHTRHSFNILEDRQELELEENQLEKVLSEMDFLSVPYIGIEVIHENGNTEFHHSESYQLFQKFYPKFKKQENIEAELFEYFKRQQLVIVRDLFDINIDLMLEQSHEFFTIVSNFIFNRSEKDVLFSEKIKSIMQQMVGYNIHEKNFANCFLKDLFEKKVEYSDMMITLESYVSGVN